MSEYPRIPMLSMQISQYPYILIHLYRRLFHKTRVFRFNGQKFSYFEHPYNRTWLNERAVEIPIIWNLMKQYAPSDVLEIGNVISHYFDFGHVIVDKYEKAHGVIQQDVVQLNLPGRFSLIATISTLEHVGWDETPRVSEKHLAAIANLKQHLAPNGLLVATFPIGYNSNMDDDLNAGRLGFDDIQYFKRLTVEDWQQVSADNTRGAIYNSPFRAANAIAIGFYTNKAM